MKEEMYVNSDWKKSCCIQCTMRLLLKLLVSGVAFIQGHTEIRQVLCESVCSVAVSSCPGTPADGAQIPLLQQGM